MNDMKIFIWAGSEKGNGYDKPTQSIKIYAVAEDLPAALRQIDTILETPGITGAAGLRQTLRNTKPQVFACPFAEVNISNGKKAIAICAAGREGGK